MSDTNAPFATDDAATVLRSGAVLVRAAHDRHGRDTELFGVSPNRVKVSAADTAGRLSLFEYEGHGRGGPPLHIHAAQDEIFVVLQGAYMFEVGGQRRRLTAGDTILAPRGVPHGFCQLEDHGRLLFMYTPAGDLEAFFEAHARLDTKPDFPARAPDLFASHGMQVVGPPIGAEPADG